MKRRGERRMGENSKAQDTLLRVENLSIAFSDGQTRGRVVEQISFSLEAGEILGIVGESGSGKSTTALALMGLLKKESICTADAICFDGKDLRGVSKEEYRNIRGLSMSMIFQEPMTSLNPVYKVGAQVEEMLRLHTKLSKEERKQKTIQAFLEAGIKDCEQVLEKYPHQLSGGQRQRVMIAMAMICEPKLLIADEPTTALDVTIQAKILALIKRLNKERKTAVILISHDIGIIRDVCDKVLVMYQGKIVERGRVDTIFAEPKEEYTKALLEAIPGYHKRLKTEEEYGTDTNVLVSVRDLTVDYGGRRRMMEAVSHLSFDIYQGQGGHLPGEIMLVDYEHKIAFTGDVFVNLKGMTPEQAAYNQYAPILMTSVDTDPVLCRQEREALLQRLGVGEWQIFGGHGMKKEYGVHL